MDLEAALMRRFVLVIPEPTPSINRLLGQHWTRKHRERERWGWLVRAARLEANAQPQRWPKAYLGITRYGAKLLDYDNCVSGAKFCVDALRREGFFEDDSPDKLEAVYAQHAVGRDKRLHRTVIILEPR